MISVLLIPSSDYFGHPFPQRHNHLFERLNKIDDFDVHILSLNIFGEHRLNTSCTIHEMPNETRVGSNTAGYYLLNLPFFAEAVNRIVTRESIDVIVMGNLAPPFAYTLRRILSRARIPVVFDLQDYYPTSAAGYIADVNSFAGKALAASFEVMLKFIVAHSDVVTVPGTALAKYAKTLRAKRIVIVPNGISENFLKLHDGSGIREKLGIQDRDFVIGYVGSIEFWLDMKTVLDSVAKAVEEGITAKLLLIGGRLQTGYAAKVETWLKERHLQENVIWCGFIDYEEVPKYIAAIQVGLIPFDVTNPTAWYASPNKTWEYLSQRKPVISTPIPEALENREILFLAKNSDDYVRTYRELVRNDLQCLKVAELGYQRAATATWDNSVRRLATVLRELAEE